MPISPIAGKAQTVLGPVDGNELGITLPHEHLIIDFAQAVFSRPEDAEGIMLSAQPMNLDIVPWVRQHRNENEDNCRLTDVDEAIKEAMLFKDQGGGTVCDMSNRGSGRNPRALARISKETGLNVIMGAGYYTNTGHPKNMDKKTVEEITDEIVRDVTEGVDGTNIKSGIIGEIGCVWPLHPNEKKCLIAAAKAQQLTGAPVNIHPGRKRGSNFEITDILRDAGADLSRVVMSHIDIRVRTHEERIKVAKSGCYLEYDNTGWDGPTPTWAFKDWDPAIDIPDDAKRVNEIKQLIADGFINQILISSDICFKHRLHRFNDNAYTHVPGYFVPLMKKMGISQKEINTIMIDNPRRMLSFA